MTALPAVVRLGPLRLTLYGVCATTGVVAAAGLSGRLAPRRGMAAETAWDAALFAILACFVSSRLLLVLRDPAAFAHYPLLVLGLPSLTLGGLALAAVATLVFLRRKGVLITGLLDIFAPGAAVLAAFLELGHALDGSEPGMPWHWSEVGRGPVRAGALQPVAWYGVAVSLLLACVLGALLVSRSWRSGKVAAAGLILGGLLAFGLAMVSLPTVVGAGLPLEPGQLVALGSALAGALLWTFAPSRGASRLPQEIAGEEGR